jgi:hypothetical protein
MRAILLAGAVLALSACGGNKANDANNMAADNMTAGDMSLDNTMGGATMGAGNMGDANMTGGAMMGANGSVSAATGNGAADARTKALMKKDLKTHDHDTNLANGI